MKIYFIFKGDGYYPSGGWDDFAGIALTLRTAEAMAKEIGWGEWSHIVQHDDRRSEFTLIRRYNVEDGYGKLIVREVSLDYDEIIQQWEVE